MSLHFIRAGITPAIKDVLPVMDMEEQLEHSTLGDHEGHQEIFDIMIASLTAMVVCTVSEAIMKFSTKNYITMRSRIMKEMLQFFVHLILRIIKNQFTRAFADECTKNCDISKPE